MKIDEIFGSPESIDIISRRDDIVDLIMIVNGYVGDSFEEQAALDRKLMYYNDWAESGEFFALYGDAKVGIVVTFTERPSDAIINRLAVWHKDMANAKSELRVMISGLPLFIIP